MDISLLPALHETSSGIPIPSLDHLRGGLPKGEGRKGELVKYKKEYEAYCKWAALPDEERMPRTQVAFEKKYKLSKNYCVIFQQREDFHDKRLTYFWNWMMDKLPNVVYSQYKLVQRTGSPQAAKFFAELIAKHIDIEKPQEMVKPFYLIGIPQDKIDKLFTPPNYEKVEDVIPVQQEK